MTRTRCYKISLVHADLSPFGREALAALDLIVAGATVDSVESETLDCKEDPSRRDADGQLVPGETEDDRAARIVADASACLSNQHGGALLVGLDDKRAGPPALLGTRLDAAWLQQRVRELTLPRLAVSVFEISATDTRVLLVEVPRNASSEPIAASVSKNGGQRRARRVGRQCQEMTSVAEMLEWARARSGYDWSSQPSGRPIDDIRPAATSELRDFLRASGEPERVNLAEERDRELLSRLQLLRPDGRLTRAGELLLCPSSTPRIRYAFRPALGARSTSRSELSDRGLAEELRAALDAFSSANPAIALPATGLAEGSVDALPFGAVREAVVNAVMHRDWDQAGPIVIDHTASELTIHSPGAFLEGVTEHTVLTAPSRTRNPHLGSVLRSLRLAEREGTGVDRMYIELVRLGHRPPSFAERDAGVRVALRGGQPVPEVVQAHATLPTALRRSARSAVVIHLLRSRPSITAEELERGRAGVR